LIYQTFNIWFTLYLSEFW